MKKTFLLIPSIAMLFASCSKDSVVDINTGIEPSRAIDFRTAVQTRAAETNSDNLEQFWVTALDATNQSYFADQEFNDTDNDNYFTSNPSYHWPADGSNLTFYCYAPDATTAGSTVKIDDTKQTIQITPKASIAEQVDFITTTTTGNSTNAETGVDLTFEHRLAQIEIQAKNANEGYVFNVAGIKIAEAVSNGTFDLANDTWTLDPTNTKTYYEATQTAADLTASYTSIMGTGGNAMLIPQQLTAWTPDTDGTNANKGAYLAVKVRIETKDGAVIYPKSDADGTHAYAAIPISTNWEAGKKYTYKLDFSNGAGHVDPDKPGGGTDILGKAIKFTVEVTPWANSDVEMPL